MKRLILVSSVMFLIGTMTVFAANKTEKFKVYGNCGSCKARIEKAASSVDGVSKADWNKETKMMEVTFEDTKTGNDAIQKAIAKVGHDTDKFKAEDKTYDSLPGCCKYERKK